MGHYRIGSHNRRLRTRLRFVGSGNKPPNHQWTNPCVDAPAANWTNSCRAIDRRILRPTLPFRDKPMSPVPPPPNCKPASIRRGPSTHLQLTVPGVLLNAALGPITVELLLTPLEDILFAKGAISVTELANEYRGRILSGTFSAYRIIDQ